MSENNAGYRNAGDYNAGGYNAGDCNAGDRNAGDRNAGDYNAGDYNAGGYNAGDRNAGDYNAGGWNSCNREVGYFNSIQSDTIRVFNKDCDREVWNNASKPDFLYFNLTKWIRLKDMTNEEKRENPHCVTNFGYLRTYDYKEAFQNSYNKTSKEDKELLLTLPNFDADVFFDISGIDVRKPDNSDKIQALKDAQADLIKKAEDIQAQIKDLDK